MVILLQLLNERVLFSLNIARLGFVILEVNMLVNCIVFELDLKKIPNIASLYIYK